ncbi:MAG TPA: ATP F0F1 synthase subunit B [Bauldia sp.]|nr:ATP F0F1 synthase subunit B [Bauldia sp.]
MEFDAPFWALISLVLFFAVIIYLKVPGTLASSLDKRADTIRNELEQAQKLRSEAEALLVEYQRKARAAEAEAGQIVEQAKREAAALATEARKRTDEYVAGRTRLAETKIAQAEAQAVQEVRALSADVAIAAAEKILTARLKGEAAGALIARSIGDVKTKLN